MSLRFSVNFSDKKVRTEKFCSPLWSDSPPMPRFLAWLCFEVGGGGGGIDVVQLSSCLEKMFLPSSSDVVEIFSRISCLSSFDCVRVRRLCFSLCSIAAVEMGGGEQNMPICSDGESL